MPIKPGTVLGIVLLFVVLLPAPNYYLNSRLATQVSNHDLTLRAVSSKDPSVCSRIEYAVGFETADNCYENIVKYALNENDCKDLPPKFEKLCRDNLPYLQVSRMSFIDLDSVPFSIDSPVPVNITEYCLDTNRNGLCEYVNYTISLNGSVPVPSMILFALRVPDSIMSVNTTLPNASGEFSFLASRENELAGDTGGVYIGDFFIFPSNADPYYQIYWNDMYQFQHRSNLEPRVPEIERSFVLNFEHNFYLVLAWALLSVILVYYAEVHKERISLRSYFSRRFGWLTKERSTYGWKWAWFEVVVALGYCATAYAGLLLEDELYWTIMNRWGIFAGHLTKWVILSILATCLLLLLIRTYTTGKKFRIICIYALCNFIIWIMFTTIQWRHLYSDWLGFTFMAIFIAQLLLAGMVVIFGALSCVDVAYYKLRHKLKKPRRVT